MSVTHNGITLPKTVAEKKAFYGIVVDRVLRKVQAKQLITNKHDQLALGTALNRMSVDDRKRWFYHMTGVTSTTVWNSYDAACKIAECRLWAKRVANRNKLFKEGDCSLAGKTQAIIDCQTWILARVNSKV